MPKNRACVIMDPIRGDVPDPDFLNYVKDSVHKAGGLLMFDEITIGRRYCFGGSHLSLGVNPDIALFAEMKAILDKDSLDAILDAIGGPVCQSGFKRLLK